MDLTRRQFLQIAGASAAGAVAFAGCSPPARELTVESTAQIPEDLVTGIDNWYATVCRICPSGCGIIVRVMEGRAKKIEGNPDHPVNRGKLCAAGQAGIQALYHPDRIKGPLRRTGPRGSGQYESISWGQALDDLMSQLKPRWANGQTDQVTLITDPVRGHLGQVLSHFARASRGLQWIPFQSLEESTLRLSLAGLLGQDARGATPPLPYFDIANARFILSFGADFLAGWLSQVQYGVGYGQFRGRPGDRGILVQVEPRITATGASADQWVPIKPGTEGILALGLANVIVSEGLAAPGAAAAFGPGSNVLQNYSPQAVSQTTGVPAEQITRLARRFASQTPGLAIGGGVAAAHTNGRFNLDAIYALNRLVGSVGKPGGILPNPQSPLAEVPSSSFAWPFSWWQELVNAINSGQAGAPAGAAAPITPPQVLLIRDSNPVYGLPPALGFADVLSKVPFIASFSSFMDETTIQADLILPGHTFLEDWGSEIPEPGPGFQVVGFQQPVVNPFYETRSFGDIMLTLAGELGLERDLPWKTFKEVLQAGAQELMSVRGGSVQGASFNEYWIKLLQKGVWTNPSVAGSVPAAAGQAGAIQPANANFVGSEQDYPFYLVPFLSASLSEGSTAFLPWLQATPDPITTIVWQTWVELSLSTAQQMGLQQGDIVRVESPQGGIEAVVYPHPGIRPDTVAIPMGQGHTASGRYARDRGVNVQVLIQPGVQGSDGALAWAATRVRLVKTGRSAQVSKLEGQTMPLEPPDVPVVGVIRQ